MNQHALDLAIAKAKRYNYPNDYVPELYAEYVAALELQEETRGKNEALRGYNKD